MTRNQDNQQPKTTESMKNTPSNDNKQTDKNTTTRKELSPKTGSQKLTHA